MRDLSSNIGVSPSIAPAVISAGTTNGAGVDLRGFDSASAVVAVGAIAGSGNMTIKLQDSDDNSTFADTVADDRIGAFAAVLLTGTTNDVGYIGGKRYVRAVATLNSGTSVAVSVVIVAGNPHRAPVV